jgi:hypothetical protein
VDRISRKGGPMTELDSSRHRHNAVPVWSSRGTHRRQGRAVR